MKKLIILFVLTISYNAIAQSNDKFFADTCYWHIYKEYPQPNGLGHSHDYHRVQGDTIYNGKIYQKLFIKSYTNSTAQPINSAVFVFNGYCLLDSNRVYIGSNIDSLKLQYDFNLAAGDSFLFPTYVTTINYYVYKYVKVNYVDSVLYGGVWRSRIVFNQVQGYDYAPPVFMVWVKGIGDPHYGPWTICASIQALERYGDLELICFTENFDPVIGVCNFVGLEELGDPNNTVIISPQPASDFIYVQSPQLIFKQEDVPVIYDVNGKQMKVIVHYINEHTYKIDVKELMGGIYVVAIKTGEGIVRKKVIIEG